MDFCKNVIERDPRLARHVERARRVLIHGFDAVISRWLRLDRPQRAAQCFTIVYTAEARAQKQGQTVWNHLARGREGGEAEALSIRARGREPPRRL